MLLSMRQKFGLIPHNDVSKKTIAPDVLVGYKRTQPNDLVLNRMQACNGMFARTPMSGLVSPDYAVFRPIADVNIEFLVHLFRIPTNRARFRQESKGLGTGMSGFLRLYSDRFGAMRMPLPPRKEQDQIVAFIRTQDRQIAKLIRGKRQLIELLNEQKQNIIHHAVTRGLNPGVPLKPSGVDWLGDVPAHWEVKRLKSFARVVLGKMLTKSGNDDGTLRPYLRSANVQWLKADIRDINEMWISKDEAETLRVRRNDLLVSEGGDVGRACLWNDEIPECYIQNSVHKITTYNEMEPWFLLYQFFTYGKRGRFEAIVNRVSIAHLTREKLVGIAFTVPPLNEQLVILQQVNKEIAPINAGIETLLKEIELIREYRDRLISDVVTGQIDVRGWQPKPDDESDTESLTALSEMDENGESLNDDEEVSDV